MTDYERAILNVLEDIRGAVRDVENAILELHLTYKRDGLGMVKVEEIDSGQN